MTSSTRYHIPGQSCVHRWPQSYSWPKLHLNYNRSSHEKAEGETARFSITSSFVISDVNLAEYKPAASGRHEVTLERSGRVEKVIPSCEHLRSLHLGSEAAEKGPKGTIQHGSSPEL